MGVSSTTTSFPTFSTVTSTTASNSTASSGGSTSTYDFVANLERNSLDMMLKQNPLQKAWEKATQNSGTWKVATLPIPEVAVDFYSDPSKK